MKTKPNGLERAPDGTKKEVWGFACCFSRSLSCTHGEMIMASYQLGPTHRTLPFQRLSFYTAIMIQRAKTGEP